jgi:hypothetical protein
MRFQVDAASLIDKQTCVRRFLLNHEYRLARWRPKLLFDTLLRRGILQLTKQIDVTQVASEAKSTFLLRAADPGLDIIGKDPYQASKGWTSLLESVLHGISRTVLPVLHDPPPARLTSSIDWRFLSWADDSGTLHRWVTVESFDADTLSRELHSWRTFGDLVMSGCPLVLHVIVLGQHRNGRFLSPWTRAYVHPAMTNLRWRWVKPDDTTWKPIQLVDQNLLDPDEWVEQAWGQRAIQPLLQDQLVDLPAESVCRDTRYQLAREASEMARLVEERVSYRTEPMSRSACDLYSPCHFQPACHAVEAVDLTQIGLYVPRKSVYSNLTVEVPDAASTQPVR